MAKKKLTKLQKLDAKIATLRERIKARERDLGDLLIKRQKMTQEPTLVYICHVCDEPLPMEDGLVKAGGCKNGCQS